MKRIMLLLIVFILILTVFPPHISAAKKAVSARSAILMDQDSGRILFEKNANEVSRIASITKIMTAILAIESGKLNKTVTISDRAVRTEGSSIYLKPGDKMKLEDLVYGLMLRSGNDAANSIAEYVGGSIEGFVFLMNQKAREIGMNNTHFANPNGLDNRNLNHFSTAYDMALLTRYAMQNKTYQKISGTKFYKGWRNKNRLLTEKYKYCTGGKTGYTKLAKRTLVTTATKNGEKLIAVTLNGPDDWNDHIWMFEYGFKSYNSTIILKQGNITAIKNKYFKNHVYIKKEVDYPLNKQEKDKVQIEYKMIKPRKSWKDKNKIPEVVGRAIIYLNNEIINSVPIYYRKSDENAKRGWIKEFLHVLLIQMGVRENG
ncbi:D-alanyl-D-alanine carboxypeptidase family protein [Bacillus sp. FJAT-49736]|uniref:D-alanyl-D-alanine carboxypeptidase family protein n=1 Tax=Bacillus sp. FJAT-49736 TaxID=2833582 RepID=UPI001BC98A11|nr:D-alanyl-D-alanine carboxypeptidase family protein [Bacillus sp. FJAT-49736]MBS4173326.1 D-alanyl-D-alanine carboxypeptidase [Bacillus sp. FJAT-49736]